MLLIFSLILLSYSSVHSAPVSDNERTEISEYSQSPAVSFDSNIASFFSRSESISNVNIDDEEDDAASSPSLRSVKSPENRGISYISQLDDDAATRNDIGYHGSSQLTTPHHYEEYHEQLNDLPSSQDIQNGRNLHRLKRKQSRIHSRSSGELYRVKIAPPIMMPPSFPTIDSSSSLPQPLEYPPPSPLKSLPDLDFEDKKKMQEVASMADILEHGNKSGGVSSCGVGESLFTDSRGLKKTETPFVLGKHVQSHQSLTDLKKKRRVSSTGDIAESTGR